LSELIDSPGDRGDLWSRIIGFGERSYQKSYYPELQNRLIELERFRSLLDQSSEAIFVSLLPSGKLIDLNDTACRLTGFSQAEICDMGLSGLIPPEAAEEIDQVSQTPLDDSLAARTIATEMQRKDQGSLPVEIISRKVSFDNAFYVVSVIRDISERKQAELDLRRQTARAEALVRIASRLNAQLDLDNLLKLVCEEAVSAMAAPAAWILLYDPRSDIFTYAASVGMPPSFQRLYHPVPRMAIQEDVFSEEKCSYLPDIQAINAWPNEGLYQEINLRTVATAVLTRGEQLVGLLVVGTFREARTFQPDELILLKGICDQAAQAIHNVRLFTNIQRHLHYERALHEIDLMITSSNDITGCMALITRQACAHLGMDASRILLIDPISQQLTPVARYGFQRDDFEPDGRLPVDPFASQVVSRRQPVIMNLTGENPAGAAARFAYYHGTPLISKGNVLGVLEVYHHSKVTAEPEWLDFFYTLATQAAIAIDNLSMVQNLAQKNRALEDAYDATLHGLSRALSLRDENTEEHTRRVRDITIRLARLMGIDEYQMVHISRGALLHDIGKLFVSDDILKKTGPLSEDEWVIMRRHPKDAYDMLWPIVYLRPAIDIPYYHHERWDGKGYPEGLRGEEIPMAARLFAVVDVWDALRTDRPYRKAMSRQKALEYIQEQSGKHFDPRCVEKFLELEPSLQADYITVNPG
jgi:PAS domain S-box-containing protein